MEVLDASVWDNGCEGPVEGLVSEVRSVDLADEVSRGSVRDDSTPASIGSRRMASYGEGVVDVTVG